MFDKRKIRVVVMGLISALVVGLLGAAPVAADAKMPIDSPRDGNVHLRFGGFPGKVVPYSGTAVDLAGYRNKLVEVWNLGYDEQLPSVNLFYNQYGWTSNLSAWACITPGWRWTSGEGSDTVKFDRGKGRAGYDMVIWNQVASVQWVSECSG